MRRNMFGTTPSCFLTPSSNGRDAVGAASIDSGVGMRDIGNSPLGLAAAAGRRLGIPLATVSRKVSELESHLRTQLLTRTRRGLTLTDAGRSYVAACKRILEEVGEAERAASGEYSAPKGDLIIAAPIV